MATKYLLQWVSKDRQGVMDCDAYNTHAEAEAAIPERKQELLKQASGGDGKNADGEIFADTIIDGSFEIYEVEQ